MTGAGGLDLTPAPNYSEQHQCGHGHGEYTYAGDDNHTGSSDSKDFTIEKAIIVDDGVMCSLGRLRFTGRRRRLAR